MDTKQQLWELIKEAQTGPTVQFKPVEEVSDKAVRNAIKAYANGCDPEDVVALLDTTLFDSGKKGFLLSTKALYNPELSLCTLPDGDVKEVPLEGIRRVSVLDGKIKYLSVRYKDGSRRDIFVNVAYWEMVKNFLTALSEQGGKAQPKALNADEAQSQERTAESYYTRARTYYENMDLETALDFYTRAAALGHARAQYECGQMYALGEVTSPDEARAMTYYEQAARQGLAPAQLCLARLYEAQGSTGEAIRWYEQAAAQARDTASRDEAAQRLAALRTK